MQLQISVQSILANIFRIWSAPFGLILFGNVSPSFQGKKNCDYLMIFCPKKIKIGAKEF